MAIHSKYIALRTIAPNVGPGYIMKGHVIVYNNFVTPDYLVAFISDNRLIFLDLHRLQSKSLFLPLIDAAGLWQEINFSA